MSVQVVHYVFVYDMFKDFACDGGERDGAIIRRVSPVSSLENRGDICAKPVVRERSGRKGLGEEDL